MKLFIGVALMLTLSHTAFSQSKTADQVVAQGVELHDDGDYNGAIRKFDEAITLDGNNQTAYYEKTLTLYAMKKYDECEALSKAFIKKFPGSKLLGPIYSNYGSALDDAGDKKQAIKVYNEGIKALPGFHLLFFNRGVTYASLNEQEKAINDFKQALRLNPGHVGSYYYLGMYLQNSNRVAASLAGLMQLILEPDSKRAANRFEFLKRQLADKAEKTGNNQTTIFLTPDMLSSKKSKGKEDSFQSIELLLALTSAAHKDSALSSIAQTEIEKFDMNLQQLIGLLPVGEKGFFSERYVPFFKALKENNYTMLVSRLVFAGTNDERNSAWLKTHTDELNDFYTWLDQYAWPK